MSDYTFIHWFRQDLRISDNPSLNFLSEKYDNIVAVYILDEVNCDRKMGSASKTWLHHSLLSLNEKLNNQLLFFKGNPEEVFNNLVENYNVKQISWCRCYESWIIKRDLNLKKKLIFQII